MLSPSGFAGQHFRKSKYWNGCRANERGFEEGSILPDTAVGLPCFAGHRQQPVHVQGPQVVGQLFASDETHQVVETSYVLAQGLVLVHLHGTSIAAGGYHAATTDSDAGGLCGC